MRIPSVLRCVCRSRFIFSFVRTRRALSSSSLCQSPAPGLLAYIFFVCAFGLPMTVQGHCTTKSFFVQPKPASKRANTKKCNFSVIRGIEKLSAQKTDTQETEYFRRPSLLPLPAAQRGKGFKNIIDQPRGRPRAAHDAQNRQLALNQLTHCGISRAVPVSACRPFASSAPHKRTRR